MKVNTITIDLAKTIFQVTGFNRAHQRIFNKRLNRNQLVEFLCNHEPCFIVMEACYSSHYWGRLLSSFGHTVKLIPAQHVTPFVRGNKNDSNDALAIYEASCRPNIRFVPIKTEAQQEILMLHKRRERLLQARTACSNQLRGLLVDFGITFPKGVKKFETAIKNLLTSNRLRPLVQEMVEADLAEFQFLKRRIATIEAKLRYHIEHDSNANIVHSIPGIGVLNASAFAASIANGKMFNKANDISVWLGLTPKQYASGTTNKMAGITKRGNPYLRKQLINGARALVAMCKSNRNKHDDALSMWIKQLLERKHFNCVVVATACKLARLMWTLLQKQQMYKPLMGNV